MKNTLTIHRLFLCLVALMVAGMLGFSACADTGYDAAQLALTVAGQALQKAEEALAGPKADYEDAQAALAEAESALAAAGLSADSSVSAEVQALNDQIAALQAEIDAAPDKKTAIKTAITAAETAAEASKAAQQTLVDEQAEKVEAAEKAVENNEAEAVIAQNKKDEAQKSLDTIYTDEALAKKDEAITALDSKKAKLEQAVTDAEQAYSYYNSQKSAYETALGELNKMEDALDTQQSIIDQETSLLQSKQEAVDAATEENNKKQAELTTAGNALTAAQEAVAYAQGIVDWAKGQDLSSLQKVYDAAKKAVDSGLYKLVGMTEEAARAALETARVELENFKNADALLEAAKTKLQEATDANTEAKEAAVQTEKDLKDANAALETERQRINDAKNYVNNNKATVEAKRTEVQNKLNWLNDNLSDGNESLKQQAQAELDAFDYEGEKATLTAEKKVFADEKERLEGVVTTQTQKLADLEADLPGLQEAVKDAKDDESELLKGLQEITDELTNKVNDLNAQIAAIDAAVVANEAKIAELNEELAGLGEDAKLISAYQSAKAAADSAKSTYDFYNNLYSKALDAYNAAKKVVDDLLASGECGHSSMQLSAFGTSFCPRKAIGSCDHDSGCCSNVNTSAIASSIKSYIAAGDFQGLKSEAQSLYSQLNVLDGSPVESVVKGLIESAVNAKANEYLGAENWAALKNLANQMMSADDLNGMINGVVSNLKNKVDSAINAALNGDPSELNALIAKVDELAANFGGIDLNVAEIKSKLEQAVKAKAQELLNAENWAALKDLADRLMSSSELQSMINGVVNNLKNKVDSAIQNALNGNAAELNALLAKIEELKAYFGNIDLSKDEIEAKLVQAAKSILSQAKNEISAMIDAAVASGNLDKVSAAVNNAIAALKNLNKAEINAAIEQFISEINSLVSSKYSAYVEQAKEEIKAMIAAGLDSECAQYIIAKAEALKAAVDAKLAEIHLCEESAEVIAAEVKALIAAFEADVLAYIENKVDDLTCEKIQQKVQQIQNAVKAFLGWLPNADLTEADVNAFINAAVSTLKDLIKEKLSGIEDIIDEILSHTWVELPYVAPTCCKTGLTAGRECLCGYDLIPQEIIPATGEHVWNTGVTIAPSCYQAGKTVYTCVNEGCGESYSVTIPATGEHVWGEGVTTEPTCLAAGTTTYTCLTAGCGAVMTVETADPIAHFYGEWTPNLDGTHTAACRRECGVTRTVQCTVMAVSADENAETVCLVCGEYKDVVFARLAAEAQGAAPKYGELTVRGMAAPTEAALYALTFCYEQGGDVVEANGVTTISVELAGIEGSFKLVRLDDGVQTEIPCTWADGVMTFDAEAAGLYLLVAAE